MSITLKGTIKVNGLPSSQEWKIIVHPAKEGGYWGEVPALCGCASFGATRSECRANVREAAIGCLEVYFEEALKKFSVKMRLFVKIGHGRRNEKTRTSLLSAA